MRILHLFSNWKWTGPAEPALNLCLSQKKLGHHVDFACGTAPADCVNRIAEKANERGLVPVSGFKMNKHLRFIDNFGDLFRLKRYLKNEKIDIVHTHMPNDHLVGGLAARRACKDILVVRTCYSGTPLSATLRNRFLFGKLTDGLITVSDSVRKDMVKRFNMSDGVVDKVEGAIDLKRFSFLNCKRDLRSELGIKEDDIVVGIVARVQWHRQFRLLLDAISIVVKSCPGVKLLIIGRGTNIEDIAVVPVREKGLSNNVIFSGYRGADYVDVLACMDINLFLVPGSDGSCRAVREVMAMGKPVITSDRGVLPELVNDGVNGIVIKEKPETLADAILKLVSNKEMRVQLGKAAKEKAENLFDLDFQASTVDQFYRKLTDVKR